MDVFGPIHTKIFCYYSHHYSCHYSCYYLHHYSCHYSYDYSHNPGTVFNSPKNITVGCPWAAHSPNVGSSWWNRIPYPFPIFYSPKQNLLSRNAQMGSKNFHTSVPRLGTNQTAPHGLKPTQAFTKHLNKV